MLDVLYHFTCDHGYRSILDTGEIRPNRSPIMPVPIAWFTDLEEPTADEVGLTSAHLTCNRLAHRLMVAADHPALVRWLDSGVHATLPMRTRQMLHFGAALPDHWWIALRAVPLYPPPFEP
jgi:hypothetical protein